MWKEMIVRIVHVCHNIATQIQEEDGKPNAQFLQEVREYFEQQSSKKPADRQARHATQGK
jgi:hypothetical protein